MHRNPGSKVCIDTDSAITSTPIRPNSTRLSSSSVRSRSEEHTSELQSLMRISYAVFCLKKKKQQQLNKPNTESNTVLTDTLEARDIRRTTFDYECASYKQYRV